jgi:hypothetical protein
MWFAVTAAIALIFARSAQAAPGTDSSGGDTLEQFLRKCKAVDVVKQRSTDFNGAEGFKAGFDFGQCVGYISGVLEFHAVMRGAEPGSAVFCLPLRGITINRVITLVTRYAEEHPEELQKSLSVELLGVLASVFTCTDAPLSTP